MGDLRAPQTRLPSRTFSLSTAGIVTSMDAPVDQGISGASEGAESAAEPVEVTFLMGSGHSGSTILGIALGNCEGFFYAGELDNWLVRKGASLLGGTERTRFWNEVRDGVEGPKRRSAPTHSATSNDPRRSCAQAARPSASGCGRAGGR